jgi:cellulose biosynthesis protein BcsQ
MLVISVVSLKGGVGKTSVTLGLAGAAAARALSTLVVDLDPQANATTALDPESVPYTSNDVLADARPGVVGDAVVQSGWSRYVGLVASEPALELRNTPEGDGTLRLRTALSGVSGYDLVMVDSPPSLGELTRNGLYAADAALVVTEPSLFALQGAQQALDAVDVVRRSGHLVLRPAGIVVNRMRPTTEHRFRVSELEQTYGGLVLQPPMPDRTAVTQAAGSCLPVQQGSSKGAREVSAIFDTYLDAILARVAAPAERMTP